MTDTELIRWLKGNPDLVAANAGLNHAPLTKPTKATPTPAGPSHLEAEFLLAWRAIEGPSLIREFRFHVDRKWSFDFAHPWTRVAIEIDGGLWVRGGGGHNSPQGYEADCYRGNAAIICGWRVFRLTGGMITIDNLQAIADYIGGRKGDLT